MNHRSRTHFSYSFRFFRIRFVMCCTDLVAMEGRRFFHFTTPIWSRSLPSLKLWTIGLCFRALVVACIFQCAVAVACIFQCAVAVACIFQCARALVPSPHSVWLGHERCSPPCPGTCPRNEDAIQGLSPYFNSRIKKKLEESQMPYCNNVQDFEASHNCMNWFW